MPPDPFGKFYRFIHYICREPGKRNIPMDLAVAAWRLLLPGRFRLLDRWCAFAAASQSRVVTEDTWRQVLDFSRTIHEDLSNYDTAGAWAVLLDEFVDDMRSSRRRNSIAAGAADMLSRRASSGADPSCGLFASGSGGGGVGGSYHGPDLNLDASALAMMSFMASISPRCGSKRREPDVDVVAEQLSAMPLGAGQGHGHEAQPPHGAGGGGAHGLPPIPPQGHDLPYSQGYGAQCRGADTVAKRVCLAPTQLSQLPQQQLLQLGPQQQHFFAPQPQPFHIGCGVISGGDAGGDNGPPGASAGGLAANPGEGYALPHVGSMGHMGVGAGMCVGSRTGSSGHPMSCSTGSMDSDARHGPVGAAAMAECGQDAGSNHVQPAHGCQQRRAIKARRSGVSDIVKSAVADALGF
ncbi:hypothetical protein GPECTOR_19g342 [Gonium pectorale]|uniref:Defective in cullin neddylation protein n=1 Tax=Gonium pectorale TaxID=33097 RepID=A0A150GJC0_GONPE|nr:hypothetical protein GPECTOR_19g342 [Gonium pectorale]|eukprot:KXZ49891.1 hypothetical protein GPECTOR_19g342 [Gonium pectorale]